MARISDQDFEKWYEKVKGWVEEYDNVGERTAVIAGFFRGMPSDMCFSPEQIDRMLDLRYPEEMK